MCNSSEAEKYMYFLLYHLIQQTHPENSSNKHGNCDDGFTLLCVKVLHLLLSRAASVLLVIDSLILWTLLGGWTPSSRYCLIWCSVVSWWRPWFRWSFIIVWPLWKPLDSKGFSHKFFLWFSIFTCLCICVWMFLQLYTAAVVFKFQFIIRKKKVPKLGSGAQTLTCKMQLYPFSYRWMVTSGQLFCKARKQLKTSCVEISNGTWGEPIHPPLLLFFFSFFFSDF